MPSISPPNLARELWMQIFTYTVKNDDCHGSLFSYTGCRTYVTATSLRISHVCRLWRNIITSLPELWSSFAMHSFPSRILPIVNLYLQHSAGRGLDVRIDVRVLGYYPSDRSGFVELASLLMQHKARFRKLTLSDEVEDFPWDSTYSPERPLFPLLESVNLSQKLSASSWLWEGIRSAPKLEDINLNENLLITDNIRDMLAGSQVRYLTIKELTSFQRGFYDFCEFLPRLHRIEIVTIYDCNNAYLLDAPLSPRKKNRRLRALAIHNFVDDPHNFLSSLELPSLQTLVLSDTGLSRSSRTAPHKASNLLVSLPRFPSLHRLSFRFRLNYDQPNPTFLIELLQCLPNLTTLDVYIEGGGSKNNILSLLFALASTPTLGRRLRSLCLKDLTEFFLDLELLNRLVEALETRVVISKERVDGNVEVAQLTKVCMFCFRWRGDPLGKTQMEYLNGKLEQLEVGGTTCAIRIISLNLFLGFKSLGESQLRFQDG